MFSILEAIKSITSRKNRKKKGEGRESRRNNRKRKEGVEKGKGRRGNGREERLGKY